jgi:hypothetical protein
VAFSWRLAQSDRDPQKYPERGLLWQYKWIANLLKYFPQITRTQIEDAFDDLARRCQRSGYGLRSIHQLRCRSAMLMGERTEARTHYRQWEKTSRDGNSDCSACEQDFRVQFHLFAGKKEKALQLAEPIVRGWLRCAEIPHVTLASILLPLLQTGQTEKAVEYHHKGYRLIRGNREFLEEVGDHLRFLALTDNLSQAVKLFEKHLEWALDSRCLYKCWKFYLAAHFLMHRLTESGPESLKLRLPKTTPCYQEEGRYEVADLLSWLQEVCRDLATRFDERNGNDGFQRRLAADRRWKRWVKPHPLRSSRKTNEAE